MVKLDNFRKYGSLFSFIYGKEWQLQRWFKTANSSSWVTDENLELE